MDYINFLSCRKFPGMTREIKELWQPVPELVKPDKVTRAGSMAEICVSSFDNNVGLITWTIAVCNAASNILGKHIPRLGQELQLEVDGFKTCSGCDMKWIESVCEYFVNETDLFIPHWLSDKKQKDVFIQRPIRTSLAGIDAVIPEEEITDSINTIAEEVSKIWEGADLNTLPCKSFINLFPDSASQVIWDVSEKWVDDFVTKVKEICTKSKDEKLIKAQLAEARSSYVAKANQVRNERPHQLQQFVNAMWGISNRLERCPRLVFDMWLDEICDRLKIPPSIQIYGLQYYDFASTDFSGEEIVTVQFVEGKNKKGEPCLIAVERFSRKTIGVVNSDMPFDPGIILSLQLERGTKKLDGSKSNFVKATVAPPELVPF